MNLTKTEHLLSYSNLRADIDCELATRKLLEFIRQSWHVIEGRLRVRLRLGWRTPKFQQEPEGADCGPDTIGAFHRRVRS